MHGAWAEVGRAHADAAADAEAMAFVRPHDIEIERHPVAGSLQADVQEVHAIGPRVRVELAHASELIEVELTRERAAALALVRGQQVWLKPRQVRVFATPTMTLEEGGSGI